MISAPTVGSAPSSRLAVGLSRLRPALPVLVIGAVLAFAAAIGCGFLIRQKDFAASAAPGRASDEGVTVAG
jgi:hypothetical protein